MISTDAHNIMQTLFKNQESVCVALHNLFISDRRSATILLTGKNGTGKRTAITQACLRAGACYHEIPAISFAPSDIYDAAEEIESWLNENEQDTTHVLYLPRINICSLQTINAISQLITKKQIRHKTSTLKLEDFFFICSTSPELQNIENDYTSTLSFDYYYQLHFDPTDDEITTLCAQIAKKYGFPQPQDDCHAIVKHILLSCENSINDLSSIFGGIITSEPKSLKISSEIITHAYTQKLYAATDITYRGKTLTQNKIELWTKQFPIPAKPHALTAVHNILKKYYITPTSYFEHIEYLIKKSEIPSKSNVIFCKWQHYGSSAPRITHEIKNFAQWKNTIGDIDLTKEPACTLPLLNDTNISFILADDFVGTGKTLCTLLETESPLIKILNKYKNSTATILTIAGYTSGIQKFKEKLTTSGEIQHRITINVAHLLTEDDKCFSTTSRIFPNEHDRDMFKLFCTTLSKEHCPNLHRNNFHLGYNQTGSLVVFPDTVPNNTISLIWASDSHSWTPLFPAAGPA